MSTLPFDGKRLLGEPARRRHVGEVGANEVSSNLVGGLLANVADVVDDDRRARFRVALRNLPADAAALRRL